MTGTDTGVGKTIATAALARRAAARGLVVVVKPVQTGVGPGSDEVADAEVVPSADRLRGPGGHLSGGPAGAGHGGPAARTYGSPPVAEYADRVRVLAESHDTVLVEGLSGGVLVRLDTEGGTILDLARPRSTPRWWW